MQSDIVKPPKEQQNIDTPVVQAPAPISASTEKKSADKPTDQQQTSATPSPDIKKDNQQATKADNPKAEEKISGQLEKPKKQSSGMLPVIIIALLVFFALAGAAVYSQIN